MMKFFTREKADTGAEIPSAADEFLDELREDDAAVERIANNRPDPGDFARIHMTKLENGTPTVHADRLKARNFQMAKAGTPIEWSRANAKLEETEPRVTAAVADLDRQESELQAQIERLRAKRGELRTELAAAREPVEVMTKARKALQSDALLPPVLVKELAVLRSKALDQLGARQRLNELSLHIRELEGATSGNHFGPGYATSCRNDSRKAGHGFYRGGQQFEGSWQAFSAWASEKLKKLEAEVTEIENSFDPAIKAEMARLRNYNLQGLV